MSVTQRNQRFSTIPRAEIPRSAFNRSCGTKTTFDVGKVVPVFADEALPGDTINLRATMLARMPTLIYPIMDNLYLDVFFFSVPIRLIWNNWQKFNGEQTDPGDSTDYTVPEITAPSGGWITGSPADHLGVPILEDLTHSALWLRAYHLIWNEWFRDQNLQDSVVVDKDDGPDTHSDYDTLLPRGKRHDYFTSCLPWTQKGTAVELPLGTSAPVTITTNGNPPNFDFAGGNTDIALRADGSDKIETVSTLTGGSPPRTLDAFGAETGLQGSADLSSATASTINAIRQAFQIQRLLERDARGGTRYTEIIRSHFGVTSDDARLQRPEYLGGGTTPIMIKQVEVTAEAGSRDTGDLAAIGTAMSQSQQFTKSFTEHCIIIGLVSARADLHYQQGLPRMFSRSTRYDFYWPALAHLGEQAVLNKEIYAKGDANDDLVFGYQERYAEYRHKQSMCTGRMRSTAGFPLDPWHLGQEFSSLPTLGDTFIQENPPIDRVVAVTSEPDFIMDARFDFIHVRPMPTYSVPGLVDHF